MERPHIFDYHDYRQFLDDFFRYKKALREEAGRATYTHEMFALEAGLKSRGALLRVINGDRHLTEALQRSVSQALGLSTVEDEFLGQLAAREKAMLEVANRTRLLEEARAAANARGATRRDQRGFEVAQRGFTEARDGLRLIDDRINGMRRMSRATSGQDAGYLLINSWGAVAVLELARCKGFTWDTDRIVKLLCDRVSAEEVERIARTLSSLGLLVEGPDGRLIPSNETVSFGNEVRADQVANYYISVYDRMGEAMRRSFTDTAYALNCRLGTATFAIPSSAVDRMRQEILRFRNQLFGFFEGLVGEPDVVYQVWLHAFPLSDVVTQDDG